MTFKPAHKQDNPALKPGQTVYGFDRYPYLKQQDTFSEDKRKLTFDEWFDEYYPSSERPDETDAQFGYLKMCRDAWNAAQENK